MSMLRIISSLLFISIAAYASGERRSLYETDLFPNEIVAVSTTFKGIPNIAGVACGYYNSAEGVFASSFTTSKIYFVATNTNCEKSNTCSAVTVAGSTVDELNDGNFDSASFSDPSRMVYLHDLQMLYVTDRANGLIRFLNLATKVVGTVKYASGAKVYVVGGSIANNNPEIDIKRSGDYLYISDSRYVYNMTGVDGSLSSVNNNAKLSRYDLLTTWQKANSYDISTVKVFISSIAINEVEGCMYVAYTFSRSAIIKMPIQLSSSSDIVKMITDDVVYSIPQSYPIPRNGLLSSATVSGFSLVTFPMNMYYDSNDNVLYWVESYAHLAAGTVSGALGAIAVRRLRFGVSDGTVDYLAGNVGSFQRILGRSTGYVDGKDNVAVFSYPVSIAFKGSTASSGMGPLMYIADYTNSAIRKVHSYINTPTPSLQPTISKTPTVKPSVSRPPSCTPSVVPSSWPSPGPSDPPTLDPSSFPTPAPVPVPSSEPTLQPSISFSPTDNMSPTVSPTMLNGDCLEIYLVDKFGDGWSGAQLSVNHSGYSSLPPKPKSKPKDKPKSKDKPKPISYDLFSSNVFSPSYDSNPMTFDICASVDEDKVWQRGLYHFGIVAASAGDIENSWEIYWRVTIRSSGASFVGNVNTEMEFKFGPSGVFDPVPSKIEKLAPPEKCRQCRRPPPKSKPKPGPKVPFVLFDSTGSGWWSSSGTGVTYSISDNSKTVLLRSGSMCGGALRDNCEEELADGDYYFRVGGGDGSVDIDSVSWSFCGVKSVAMNELSFAVVGGECVPGALRTSKMISTLDEKSSVSIQGELLIENLFSDSLSVQDVRVLESGIAEAAGVDSDHVSVLSYCFTQSGVFCSGFTRKLKEGNLVAGDIATVSSDSDKRHLGTTFVVDVVFEITVVAEEYGVRGANYHEALDLITGHSTSMLASLTASSIQGSVRSESVAWSQGQSGRSSPLAYARVAQYLSEEEFSIKYSYVPHQQDADEPLAEEGSLAPAVIVIVDESLAQEALVLIPLMVVLGVLVSLFMYSRRKRGEEDSSAASDVPIMGSGVDLESDISYQVSQSNSGFYHHSTNTEDINLDENLDSDIHMHARSVVLENCVDSTVARERFRPNVSSSTHSSNVEDVRSLD